MRLLLTIFILAAMAIAPPSPAAPSETMGRGQAQGAQDERMSAALYYNRAQNTIKKGAYGEALEAVIEGTRIDPSYPPFLWQKALVLTRLKQHEEAGRALELAMLTMPDNVELSALAVENITALYALEPDRLDTLLTAHFKRVDPRIIPALIYGLTENYAPRGQEFRQVFKALEKAEILDDVDQSVLAACLDDQPETAAAILKETVNGGQDMLPAALSVLAAEGLQLKKKTAQADEMYDQAVGLGYKREKTIESRGRIFMEIGDPARSAEAYAGFWRASSAPSVWAIKAAEGYAAAGQKGEALSVLESALEVAPNDPYLTGWYYYYLDLAGKERELTSLASGLESPTQLLALDYGKFMSATRQGDSAAANQAREGIIKNVENISSMYEQESVRRIIESLGLSGPISPLERQANLLRATGWELWNEGKYNEAFTYFKDAVSLDPGRNRISGANISVQLVQQGLVPQALELFEKQFPELPPLALGLMMMRGEQWYAALPLLSQIETPGDLKAWQALGLAYSTLKNGSREEVEAAAQKFLSLAPPEKTQTVMIPDQALDNGYYVSLLKAFFSELLRQGYSGLFDSILQSGHFRVIPPAEGAVLLADAAFELTAGGEAETAPPLWRAARALDPGLPEANLGLALVEKMRGNDGASAAYLRAGLAGNSLKKSYILGRLKMLDGQKEEAAGHFEAYMRREPENLSACFELFRLYMSMPDYRRARAMRAHFEKYGHLPESPMYQAWCNLELGYYQDAEKMFRVMLRGNPGSAPAAVGLVAVLRAQDRFEEAAAVLAAHNLEDPEVLTALRQKAEAALAARKPVEARKFAEAYLKRAPDAPYLNDLYNTALREEYRLESEKLERLKHDRQKLDRGRLDPASLEPERLAELQSLDPKTFDELKADDAPLAAAEEHARNLLERNPLQRNALEGLLDLTLERGDFEKAADLSKDLAAAFPQDPHYLLQSALHLGAISRFDHAFPLVEKTADLGANASAMAAHFANISAVKRPDAFTARDIEDHLEKFQERFRIVSSAEIASWPGARADRQKAEKIPMLLIIGRAGPAEVAAIDAALERCQARAALLVSEESFTPGTPANFPDTAYLRHLAASGRWEFILTDTLPRTITLDTSGRLGNFWAGRGLVNGRPETAAEMKKRWSNQIAAIKEKARGQGFDPATWMYPGGDYGQIGLDGGPEIRQAYTEAVREHFSRSFAPTGTGYHLDSAEPLSIPVRNLYFPLDDQALKAISEVHPSRLAVLDEAILSSWHGQLPRAEHLFARAAEFDLSARDITYYRAGNALYDGDVPYANELARAARALDPDALRTDILVERTHRLLRPRLSFTPRWWHDDAGRRYAEYITTLYGHVREDLALYTSLSYLDWNHISGQAGSVGLRYYPFPQHWLDLMFRGVRTGGGGSSFAEWRADWRGAYALDFLKANGAYNLVYSRENIETWESIAEGIYADRLAASTTMRVLNWGVLEADIYGVNRTDGNWTVGGRLSPRYIVWDKPHLEVGYLLGLADSDRNPPEYYAPQSYVNHMGVISGTYELFKDFFLRGFLSYGTAKSRGNDWQEVLRYNAGFDWKFNEDFSLRGGYQHLELPGYILDQYTLGLQYIF